MSKQQMKVDPDKSGKDKDQKNKDRKDKDEKALVGRIKKVVKKSRRKLGEEKFEKQLQRTIAFLEGIQSKIGGAKSAVHAVKVEKQKKVKGNGKAAAEKTDSGVKRAKALKREKSAVK